jgi:thioesterase domain-containing protein
VIYTSGSTGQPKGVMIEHGAALNTITDINERLDLGPRDVVFGVSSLSFDLSVWDIFGTLSAGGTLVLPDDTSRPDPLGWAAAAAEHGVTIWNSVPALAEMLVEVAEQRPGLGHPPIRAFLLSGDWIPTSLPGRMRDVWPGLRIMAMGGATEASIWTNLWEVGRVDPSWRSIPYGRPLRNQTMSVLDHELRVRAPWATGRIYIGGAGLARGYWRDEARTAERFITHPVTGMRLYWTGDLGRYWPDGTIEFLGREDRQVKVQGFRIEPGEVEAAIRSHPGVRDCVVCSVAGAGEQRRLVAFVVPAPSVPASGPRITAHARDRLPYYMVPAEVHIVERLPLTSNGKVDIARALALRGGPFPGGASADGLPADAADAAGGSLLLTAVHHLWAELLQVSRVSPDAEFFALGGNSVLALRLINRIHTELGISLPFGAIFEAPTLRAFTRRLEASGHDAAAGQGAECEVTLSTGEGQELLLFHPVGGAVTCYTALARAWPGPVRAFQSRGLSGTAGVAGDPAPEPPDRQPPDPQPPDGQAPDGLEMMASDYRARLQRGTPRGPYVLGGWSMGGVLAYEIGRQLTAAGESCTVFMIDSDITGTRLPGSDAARHLEFLNDLAGGALPTAVSESVLAAGAEALTAVARDAAVAHNLLPAEVSADGYRRLMRVHSHNLASLAAYRPRPASMRTLLLVAGHVERPDPSPAWRAVCPGIEVETWPDDHYSIMSADRVPAIVERVMAWLSPVADATAR